MAGRPDVSALENLRLAQVYNTVVRYMLDMAVDRGPLAGARRRVQYWLHDIPVEPVALGTPTKVRLLLQELGPTYVKVGQLVSSQSHVLPDDWEREVLELCDTVEAGTRDYAALLSENPIWLERTVGVGTITTEEALALGVTGPILRSTGFPWDLRRAQPYLVYDDVDFEVVYTENGDSYDRYLVRLYEILESVKIVRQCVERMPLGDYRSVDRKVTPPPRARIDESMEALIHHFKLFTEGFRVPPGETYVAIESPRGEIGCYLVSDGTGKPVRLHIRGPSFYNLQSMEAMVPGTLVADAVAIVSGIDPVMGEVDR